MTDRDKALKALTELRPPAADPFTYLAAVEEYISPDILPEFNEILQDVELTSLIGWDLVDKLVVLDGCEPCLETIARLGNPREVIIKVLEVLEQMQRGVLGIAGGETLEEYEEESDDEDADTADKGSGVTADAAAAAADYTRRFIILTGMLSILHQRLRTRHPSRFLAPSLSAVFTAYASPGAPGPSDQTTAAVINLVHTLSGRCRPALPSRRSSVDVAHPGMDRDAARRNAPDPEGQEGATGTPDGTGPVAGEGNSDPVEEAMQTRLLLSFVTFVLEAYVNEKGLAWSPRLYEHLNAEAATKLGRTTLMEYREDEGLLARDSIVGKLVALAQDLGLRGPSKELLEWTCKPRARKTPLSDLDDISRPDQIPLSTGGSICLLAYWVFSMTVFEAKHSEVQMDMFPHHSAMMKVLITDDNAMSEIPRSSGTIDAAITLGLWLDHTTPVPTSPSPDTDYMAYHHVLTLCAVFHPAPKVRQAASILAGLVLHRNPDDADRLRILEDILENCSFPALSACAVSWLREELMRSLTGSEPANRFSTPEALEHLQYCVFPNLASLLDASPEDIWDFWAQNAAFHLQVTNFAYFVFQPAYRNRAVPDGMRAAVEERYLKPLRHVSSVVKKIASQEKLDGKATMLAMEADILGSRIDMALAA